MSRHAVTLLCLLVAAVCYVIGFGLGIGVALVVGFVGEIAFWVRLSKSLSRRCHVAAKGK